MASIEEMYTQLKYISDRPTIIHISTSWICDRVIVNLFWMLKKSCHLSRIYHGDICVYAMDEIIDETYVSHHVVDSTHILYTLNIIT